MPDEPRHFGLSVETWDLLWILVLCGLALAVLLRHGEEWLGAAW